MQQNPPSTDRNPFLTRLCLVLWVGIGFAVGYYCRESKEETLLQISLALMAVGTGAYAVRFAIKFGRNV